MSRFAVIYWSGTGNTEQMANAVNEGIIESGNEADVLTSAEFNCGLIENYAGFAFGCPSMGAEQLEESEFEPMFEEVKASLNGKKVALFGSFGWGDGEWMRNWYADCENNGCILVCDPIICNGAPDSQTEQELKELGKALVS